MHSMYSAYNAPRIWPYDRPNIALPLPRIIFQPRRCTRNTFSFRLEGISFEKQERRILSIPRVAFRTDEEGEKWEKGGGGEAIITAIGVEGLRLQTALSRFVLLLSCFLRINARVAYEQGRGE